MLYFLFTFLFIERVQQLKEIEEEWERKNHALTNELARIETLLSSAYDR